MVVFAQSFAIAQAATGIRASEAAALPPNGRHGRATEQGEGCAASWGRRERRACLRLRHPRKEDTWHPARRLWGPMRLAFRVVLKIVAAALLIAAQLTAILAQTDEELRQLYLKRDFDRIEQFARDGHTRAEAIMGLIKNQSGRRSEAKEWYRRAAEKDHELAINSLAAIYYSEKDYVEAVRWYKRGAELGNENNQHRYAAMLLEGQGIAKDEREALRWLRAAADNRNTYSNVVLARLYAEGIGTERDIVQAYAHLIVALNALRESNVPFIAEARKLKAQIEPELSPSQIEEARQRARGLRPGRVRL
jgi:tetratricopeptide (TPR) repeat protein